MVRLLLANGDVYVGSSNDLRRRIASHESGGVQSTKAYLPVKLLSYVAVGDEALARSLERYFKTGSGKAVASKRFWRRDPVIPPQQQFANSSGPQSEGRTTSSRRRRRNLGRWRGFKKRRGRRKADRRQDRG